MEQIRVETEEIYGGLLTILWADKTTVCVILNDKGIMVGKGIARCMPNDKFSQQVGRGIAEARAFKEFFAQTEEEWLKRSVTKEQWDAKHSKKRS